MVRRTVVSLAHQGSSLIFSDDSVALSIFYFSPMSLSPAICCAVTFTSPLSRRRWIQPHQALPPLDSTARSYDDMCHCSIPYGLRPSSTHMFTSLLLLGNDASSNFSNSHHRRILWGGATTTYTSSDSMVRSCANCNRGQPKKR
jgi:hypothetical protein